MKPKEKIINIKDNVLGFRKEIQDLQAKEKVGGETVHLEGVKAEDLTSEDMKMWERYKDRMLTEEDFEKYRDSVLKGDNKSRQYFVGFLANKLTPEWIKKRA